jgi:hypothetical protein
MVVFDNLKGPAFSSETVEALVTGPVISGYELYRGEGQRPNTLTVGVTGNGVRLSTDLARRLVPVRLGRPVYVSGWQAETEALVDEHRDAILGDLAAALRLPAATVLGRHSSWPRWEADVLCRFPDADRLADLIERRRQAANADTDHVAAVQTALAEAAGELAPDESGRVAFSTDDLAAILTRIHGRPVGAIETGRFLATHEDDLPRLTKKRKGVGMKYFWQADAGEAGCQAMQPVVER